MKRFRPYCNTHMTVPQTIFESKSPNHQQHSNHRPRMWWTYSNSGKPSKEFIVFFRKVRIVNWWILTSRVEISWEQDYFELDDWSRRLWRDICLLCGTFGQAVWLEERKYVQRRLDTKTSTAYDEVHGLRMSQTLVSQNLERLSGSPTRYCIDSQPNEAERPTLPASHYLEFTTFSSLKPYVKKQDIPILPYDARFVKSIRRSRGRRARWNMDNN